MRPLMQIATTVEALRYDGSEVSAQAIAQAFPDCVALPTDRQIDLRVVSRDRLIPVPKGWWVVQFVRFGNIEVMDPTTWRIADLTETSRP